MLMSGVALPVANECGYAGSAGQLSAYKKADLVNSLIRHFQTAKGCTHAPTAAAQKAQEWLPEAMLFPAVDPGAPAEVEDEADSVDEGTGED